MGLAAVLPFTLFVPFNIMALSYNSMGVQFLTVALATMTLDRPNRGLMFLAGLFFAAAVLCCPYLVALYPVYLLVYIISSIRRARGKEKQRTPELRTDFFLCFTAGCAVLGIATMLLLFQSSLSEIIAAMPGIFSDNSHPQSSLLDKINSYLAAVLSSNPVAKFVIAALTALLLAWVIDVKWLKRRGQDLIFVLSLLICGINMLCFFRGMKFINFCFFPLMFAGLFAFITDRERNWRLFCFFWLPALAYSFCIHLGSNQGVYAISNALAVQSVSSILLIGCRFKHLTPVSAKLSSALAVLLVGTCCFALVYCRAQYCFWDEPVSELNCWIGYGSNAGQWTTEERYQVYEQLVNDTQLVREQEGKVLYYSKDTCLYLMDDKEMAAYSAWLAIDYANNSEWQRLLLYYELNPDKLPDCIYLSKAIDLRPQQLLDDLEMTGEVVEGTFGWSLLNLSHLP